MSSRSSVLASFGLGMVFLISGGIVIAKNHPQKPPKPPAPTQPKTKVETVALEGTIEAIGSKGFKATASRLKAGKKQGGDSEWLIAVTGNTVWLVSGAATTSYLQNDQTVIFKADLDAKSQPADKVSDLTIVSARGHTPAITADDGTNSQSKKHNASTDATDTKDSKADAVAADIPKGKCKIVGKLSVSSDSKYTAHTGATAVPFELAESPTINVSMSDHSLIAVGAKVTIRGRSVENNQGKIVYATNIAVTLTQPLTGKEKPVVLQSSTDKSDPDASSPDSDSSPGIDAADAAAKDAASSDTKDKATTDDAAKDAAAKDVKPADKPVTDAVPKADATPEKK